MDDGPLHPKDGELFFIDTLAKLGISRLTTSDAHWWPYRIRALATLAVLAVD